MLSEGSLPCKAHTKIQYISNKGAVNELNKNNQKKEKQGQRKAWRIPSPKNLTL
jgi:hypothetical protein